MTEGMAEMMKGNGPRGKGSGLKRSKKSEWGAWEEEAQMTDSNGLD